MASAQDIQTRLDAASDVILRAEQRGSAPSWALRVKVDPFTEGAWTTIRVREGTSIAGALEAIEVPNDENAKVEINGVGIPPDKRGMLKPKDGRVVSLEPTPSGGGNRGSFLGSLAAAAFVFAGAPFVFASFAVAIGSIYDYRVAQKNRRPPAPLQGPRTEATGSNSAEKGQPLPLIAGRIRFTPPLAMLPSSEFIGDSNDQYFKTAVFWGHGPMDISDVRFGAGSGDDNIKPESEIIDSSDEWVRNDYEGKGGIVFVDRLDEERVNVVPSTTEHIFTTERQTDRMKIVVRHSRRFRWYISYIYDTRDSGTVIRRTVEGSVSRTMKVQYRKKADPGETPAAWKDVIEVRFSGSSGGEETAIPIDGGPDPRRRGETLPLPEGRGIYEVRVTGTHTERSPGNPDDYNNGRIYKSDYLAVTKFISEADEAPVTRAGVAVSAWKIRLGSDESRVVREINAVGGTKVFKYQSDENADDYGTWPEDTAANRKDPAKFGISTNPADWFVAYICSTDFNRFPKARSVLDIGNLGEWWEFCNDKGLKWSLRDHRNLSLNDLLNDVAAAGLSQPTLTGLWGVVTDKPNPRSEWLFNPANTANFQIQADRVRVPHAYRVTFEDERRDWEQNVRIVYRDGYNLDGTGTYTVSGVTKNNQRATHIEDLSLPGVTDERQVYILARHRLAALLHRPHLVTFDVDYAAMAVEFGDRCTLTHDGALVGQAWGTVSDTRAVQGTKVEYGDWALGRGLDSVATNFSTLNPGNEVQYGSFRGGATDAPLGWVYDGVYATWTEGNTQYLIAAFGNSESFGTSRGGKAVRTRTRSAGNAPWSAWSAWSANTSAFEVNDADRVSGDSKRPALFHVGVHANGPTDNPISRRGRSVKGAWAILEDYPDGAAPQRQRVYQAFYGSRIWERVVSGVGNAAGGFLTLSDLVTFENGKTYKIIVALANGDKVTLAASAPSSLSGGLGSTHVVKVPRLSGIEEGNIFSFGESGAEYKVAAIDPLAEGRATLSLVNYGGDAVFNSADSIPPLETIVHRPVSPTLTGPLPPIINEADIISNEDALPQTVGGDAVPTILVPFELSPDDPENPYATSPDHVSIYYREAHDVDGAELVATAPVADRRVYIPNVKPGVEYAMRARCVDRERGFSRVVTFSHVAVGLGAPPPDILDLDMEAAGGTTQLTWVLPDLPRDAKFVELRYASTPGIRNWDEMRFAARVAIGNTSKSLPTLNGTYAAKIVDVGGNYSDNAYFRDARLHNPPEAINIQAEHDENPSWSGTKTNVVVRNGLLELERVTVSAGNPEIGDWPRLGDLARVGGTLASERFYDSGFYLGEVQDLGAVYDVKVEAPLVADSPLNIAHAMRDIEDMEDEADMSFTPDDDIARHSVQMRTATEDPTNNAGAWSGWNDVFSSRVSARYVQLRVILSSADGTVTPLIESMGVRVYAVQRTLTGVVQTRNGGDTTVTFSPQFEDDQVFLTTQLGNDQEAGDIVNIVTGPTKTAAASRSTCATAASGWQGSLDGTRWAGGAAPVDFSRPTRYTGGADSEVERMSQDYTFTRKSAGGTSGTQMVGYHNDSNSDLRSFESGPTPPANPVKGQFWFDESSQTYPAMKQYTGSAWVAIFVLDTVNNRSRMMHGPNSYTAPTGVDGEVGIYLDGVLSFIYSASGLVVGGTSSTHALDLSAKTGGLAFPRGPTSQRPPPTAGAGWYDTTLQKHLIADGVNWNILGEEGGTSIIFRSKLEPGTGQYATLTGVPNGVRHVRVVYDIPYFPRSPSHGRVVFGMQLGDSGDYETTGYSGTDGGAEFWGLTSRSGSTFANNVRGTIDIWNMDGNGWWDGTNLRKTLSGSLDRIRFGFEDQGAANSAFGNISFLTARPSNPANPTEVYVQYE